MEAMVETCCGIDVHQKSIVCCILDGPLDTNKPKKFQKSFGTTTRSLQGALDWMLDHGVTHVFLESTGQYWIPVFNIFSESSLEFALAHPQRVKNVPGRKTDMKDAEWLAQLGRCGLIESSYLPTPEVMELRLLTRRYRSYKESLTQIKNEIHNLLQRSNIKLTSFLSDIFSKTGQALLELFINGEVIDEESVRACMHGRIKAQAIDLVEAMNGKLSSEDCFLMSQSLIQYRMIQSLIEDLDKHIKSYINKHFPEEYQLLMTVPGVSENAAAVILAEIGPDVDAFPTDGHLASWAGLSPGSHESAGIKKSSRITQGNKYLKHALTISGMIAGHSKDPAFSSLYNRVSQRGSKMKAVIACAHKILRIVYKLLETHQTYEAVKALGMRQHP